MKNQTPNSLLRYSRAGDVFHYRWAARRCLRMINPRSNLKSVIIEGSKENKKAGEYVIDLAEYSEFGARKKKIEFFQLKHSTVRKHTAFTLNELKATVAGFAKRFRASGVTTGHTPQEESVAFTIVTNRLISQRLKEGIRAISSGKKATPKLHRDLERATRLKGAVLGNFCALVSFVDGEGDYVVQREKLRGELNEHVAGFVREEEIDHVIALVADRALPNSSGLILPEHVLDRLGVSSTRGLFPAPPQFEELPKLVRREQHDGLLKHILTAPGPIIIHAAGGVGKSVFARQILESLPVCSRGFIYDCFGSGKYRNPSEPRHRACDALVQIVNEMASLGLCRPVIVHPGAPADTVFGIFLQRVEQASNSLRAVNRHALLVLLIDAADNAEIAAAEVRDQCFASALLRENLPSSCRLVMFSRTERIELLHPQSRVKQYLLDSFTANETAAHLYNFFPAASEKDGLEFHRLSGGNPRVQANALAADHKTVHDALTRLGPSGTTVQDQIEAQLDSAVAELKDKYPDTIQVQIDSICKGLANLPPFIPIEVLARAAGVKEAAISSFVSDLGRPLWRSDDAVQFRDEPTETWFRKHFSADPATIKLYARAIESLAGRYTYVAKVLPQLLMRGGDYDRLITLALSDGFLPENNPIDERDIRVYRLQFAFKAALKMGRLADAARLAFRAGEEVAGDRRQMELLRANIDLIAPLQDPHRVQELSYRQTFQSAWKGSANVYSAALLSSVQDFKGEARSYLRSAWRWLQIYFEERDARARREGFPSAPQEELTDADLAEFAWTLYNLQGAEGALRFFRQWKSPHLIFRLAHIFVHRLIDAGRFEEIDKLACLSFKNLFVTLALVDELLSVGRFPPKQSLRGAVNALSRKRKLIRKARSCVDMNLFTPAIISLAEASVFRGLSQKKVRSVLEFYTFSVGDADLGGNFQEDKRRTFLRGVALRSVLGGNFSPDISTLLPKKDASDRTSHLQGESEREFREVVEILLPWLILRARLLLRDPNADDVEVRRLRSITEGILESRYRRNDRIPYEVTRIQFEALALEGSAISKDNLEFLTNVLNASDSTFALLDRLEALRAACRLDHLRDLRTPLEQSCSKTIGLAGAERPEERADWFVSLARAVLPVSQADAAAYFNQAIESVSKFGDEVVERWGALVAVAERAAEKKTPFPELSYRFIRCAEVVGESAGEDHWDRNHSMRIAVRLYAPSAFAGLSRWRDRGVGWFNDQLLALATEAVEQEIIPPSVAWCFSGFERCNGSVAYAAACIRHEKIKVQQQRIFNQAIRDCELCGAALESWNALEAIANQYQLEKGSVAGTVRGRTTETAPELSSQSGSKVSDSFDLGQKQISWHRFFENRDLLSPEGLNAAKQALDKTGSMGGLKLFWHELIQRVPAGNESQFLRALIGSEALDIYDISNAIDEIHPGWLQKAAVKQNWPSFLTAIGKRFAAEIVCNDYWKRTFQSLTQPGENHSLQKGVFEGLAESLDLVDAGTFFGFVSNVSNLLSLEEASALLGFALSRFEKHIPGEFGDGPWAEWLNAPANAPEVVAEFLWAALGSPYSGVRWQAAHSIRRLGENMCSAETAALVSLIQSKSAGPFVSPRLPFYYLHSKLYLLIAFARVAIDQPDLLKPYAETFAEIALNGLPHILIQKTAAEIALSVERANPRSYSARVTMKLKKVGSSPFAVKKAKRTRISQEPLRRQEENNLRYRFALDFDRYWFQPLGELFGVSADEVTGSAAEVAIREFNIPMTEGYVPDPRQEQWNTLDQRGSMTTYAHHGEYPRVERYDFYFSYHSCLAVASQLLSKMPVVQRWHYDEDPWGDWLRWHLLSRRDGKWLMERRDPSPVKRRDWVTKKPEENWLWGVTADDFFDCLTGQSPLAESIFVSGYWCECKGDLVENISISSALLNPEAADALANALRSAEDSNGFRLPNYLDEEAEFHKPPFELLGWIREGRPGNYGIDQFDPYAKEVTYPPDSVDDSFTAMLGLSTDPEGREWHLQRGILPSLTCEVWSEKTINPREEPFRHGQRNAASCRLLKKLCALTGKELIIEVRISRTEHRSRYSRRDNDFGYIPPSHKIFILSSNGILTDKDKSYKLG
ncbi:MAG TPA: ATP-binding protein [Candidatus Binatia bacterium]|jgi:hypothetical protein|nr:ATP-binding protein [Candidatus Binatia bacterium]